MRGAVDEKNVYRVIGPCFILSIWTTAESTTAARTANAACYNSHGANAE
jgi:hypothetical protein